MDRPLTRTRLTAPPPPRRFVRRGLLIDALEREVSAHPLTLVSAPAGYGKSTLLAAWARETALPTAWLTVEREDDDVVTFLRCLVAAWEQADPSIITEPPGILLGGMGPDANAAATEVVEAIAHRDEPLVFVLDDWHLIADTRVHEVLTWVIDHMPPHGHVILGTRERPPMPLARYRARQQVYELDAEDLRFGDAETTTFFNDVLALDLPGDRIGAITERVEGWIAGLQMAALSLAGGSAATAETVSGRQRFIADYLRDEVLESVPAEMHEFLVATSVVDRVNAALAAEITGVTDAQQMLEQIEAANLFAQPLDDRREWYRYHSLFADVLRAELARRPAGEVRELHLRASRWYLDNHHPEPAFVHAVAAEDVQATAAVLDRFGLLMMRTGQLADLGRWLRAIPPDWYRAAPRLELLRVGLLLFSGQIDAGIEALAEADRRIMAMEPPAPRAQARLTAVKCFIACITSDVDRARSLADSALQTLVPADEDFRADVFGALGDTCRRIGLWDDARGYYRHMLRQTGSPAGHVQALHAWGALADLELRRGRLRGAAGYWRQALERFESPELWGGYELPAVGWVHIRQGEIFYEWNDLRAAADACDRGRERAELGGDPRAIIASGLLSARLHLARGDADAAEADLERIRDVAAETQFPDLQAELERRQVEIWLAQGRLRAAVLWTDEAVARDAGALPDQEPVMFAIARVLITKGDATSAEEALRVLAPVIHQSTADGRDGVRIAGLTLRALALAGRGDTTGALGALEPALRLAEPDGYIRSFLDLGLPMARLLQVAAARGILPDYVDILLAAFGEVALATGSDATGLPEPLSEREVEVLRSIAAGLTNREIADALYISPETVKKHAGNIYGKLGVHGRTQAIATARELDLLD